jgi:hypothetical protein
VTAAASLSTAAQWHCASALMRRAGPLAAAEYMPVRRGGEGNSVKSGADFVKIFAKRPMWLAWRCLSLLLLLHATAAGCATSHRRHSRQA